MKAWRHSIMALAAFFGLALVAQADEQPRMHAAHHDLWVAKLCLDTAKDNKGWHKVTAMKLITDAMKEVHEGIVFDNKHEGAHENKDGEKKAKEEHGKVGKDHQRWMHAAQEWAEKAKAELAAATEDKGGHRKKALELTEAALVEIRLGVKYADEHKE